MSASVDLFAPLGAMAAYAAALVLLALLHARDPRDPLRVAVSDYANGPASALFTAYGACGIAGALALAAAAWSLAQGKLAALLAALAVLRLGVLFWRTDAGGTAQTRAGRLHLLFAVVTFTLAYEVVSVGTPFALASSRPDWFAYWHFMAWLVPLALAAVVATLVLPALRRWFGLAERTFLVSTLVWNASLAAAIAAQAFGPSAR